MLIYAPTTSVVTVVGDDKADAGMNAIEEDDDAVLSKTNNVPSTDVGEWN